MILQKKKNTFIGRIQRFFPNFAIMNISWSEIKPYENELPTNYADRIGRLYTDTVTAAFKKSNGQFFLSLIHI